ncbi:MAG: dihydrolipoamide acetyltransferase family protein [Qingshengfaniella sp.]
MVPLEQEGTEAKVLEWLVEPGSPVAENDPIVELETDKVTVEIPSPCAGILTEILLEKGAQAVPGAVIARIETAMAEGQAPAAHTAGSASATAAASPATRVAAQGETRHSPAVRRALRETGIDPAGIAGTGKNGRLTRADVEAAARTRAMAQAQAPVSPVAEDNRIIPHDSMRLAIARNMVKSLSEAPQVTAVFEADFSAIISHRKQHKAAFELDGINLSYTTYIVRACARAMRAVPVVNSKWHDDHLQIFPDVNIGVGTALGDEGLVVPVIRQVQNLSLRGIAARLQDVTVRARSKSLTAADMQGGTFTISNHGVSGSLLAAPIVIHQGQSAILGVGKLEKRVVVREVDGQDTIQIRPMCYVTLTIDHRVIDGFQTNAWLAAFVQALEGDIHD